LKYRIIGAAAIKSLILVSSTGSIMEPYDIPGVFEGGGIHLPGHFLRAEEASWYPHPEWDGVFIQDLVTAGKTNGAFSCHLVRVTRGSEAADHAHSVQWELNVLLAGTGFMVLDGEALSLDRTGQTFATPPRIRHAVRAGDVELSLLALFIPALT